jgi:hypothetical protein
MRGFANVFLLELRMRRVVIPAALVAGLVPIPLAFFMRSVASFTDCVSVGAGAFALIGGELLALILGGTVLCQDLSEGRAGFYLSKPVSPLALWAGKMLAAWALVLAGVLVCLIPATLLGGGLAEVQPKPNPFFVYDIGPEMLSALWTPLVLAVLFLGFIAFAHALSVMFRSRSAWLILDAVMVVLLPALVWWALKRVLQMGSVYLIVLEGTVLCGVVFAGLLVAGAVQTVVGRADLKRGHKALSLTLWAILGIGVLFLDGHAYWAARISPSDLAKVDNILAAPAGPWMVIAGPLKYRGPEAWAGVLLNGDTGASHTLRTLRWGGDPLFSPNGRLAVSVTPTLPLGQAPAELLVSDLAGSKPEARSTGITLSDNDSDLAFAPDSSRLAVQSGSDLAIYDLPSWKLLAAQRLPTPPDGWRSWQMYFLDRETLRLGLLADQKVDGMLAKETSLQLFEFDIRNRKLSETGRVDSVQRWTYRVNAKGDRCLLFHDPLKGDRSLLLCDARTGEVLKPLVAGDSHRAARFLSDGRIAVLGRREVPPGGEETPRQVMIYSPEGAEMRSVDLGAYRYLIWGWEPAPGKVLINAAHRKNGVITQDALLLDVDMGTVKKLEGLRPASMFSWWFSVLRDTQPPGSPGSHLFIDDQGRVVRYDFETGTKTVVKVS